MEGAANKPSEFELADGGSRRPPTKAEVCTTSRLWLPLSICFLCTSLAMAIYIIYANTRVQAVDLSRDEMILAQYGFFFRTPSEEQRFEEEYIRATSSNLTKGVLVNDTSLSTCGFSCGYINRTVRDTHVAQPLVAMYSPAHVLFKRQSTSARLTYHGCCTSEVKFISPETAHDLEGKYWKLIRLKGDRKQYFVSEKCQHAYRCIGCTCQQELTAARAVVTPVDNNSEIYIKFILLPGCCKCVNGNFK